MSRQITNRERVGGDGWQPNPLVGALAALAMAGQVAKLGVEGKQLMSRQRIRKLRKRKSR